LGVVARELLLEVLEVKSFTFLEAEELLKSLVGVDDAAVGFITELLVTNICVDLLGDFSSGELYICGEVEELAESFRNRGSLGKARRSTVLLGGRTLGLATSLYFTGVKLFSHLHEGINFLVKDLDGCTLFTYNSHYRFICFITFFCGSFDGGYFYYRGGDRFRDDFFGFGGLASFG
jgi:hypothetical protein